MAYIHTRKAGNIYMYCTTSSNVEEPWVNIPSKEKSWTMREKRT
jgi:hypothetical protein